ncbi:carbohydrate ABC transporter permease [Brachybacterium sacelli]|uniref:Multiple sugar transport system permease protein n=1 Tax=Brachybacterium sacelli TaxID=173364 RepID=A0ABS4WVL3_9MICO|nr:carbohydrate ABC transporter permease [Brachybacterium sacelli]MBP2380241.1 multiple sugar transport system permease protein [Brachybacterium sacelli]
MPRSRASTSDRQAGSSDRRAGPYALLGVLFALIFTVPLLWSILRAFQPHEVILGTPGWSEMSDLTWENFSFFLSSQGTMLRPVLNSIVVSLSTAALTALVATLAGYGFSKFAFRGSRVAFSLILLTMMVPFQAILTPLYLLMNSVGLTDSLVGLVLFSTNFALPFGIFLMKNTFDTVPQALEDSAIIDGAGTGRMLVDVLRPMILPGIASSALYAFLTSWTEFLGALTFLTSEKYFTLPVALLNIQVGTYGEVDFGQLVAGSVIAMIPCVVLYVSLQRFYVRGLAAGAVKG